MKCPNCGKEIHWDNRTISSSELVSNFHDGITLVYGAESDFYPGCDGLIVKLIRSEYGQCVDQSGTTQPEIIGEPETTTVWPKNIYRELCPPEIPKDVAADYEEACAIIDISPTAAAALARRCMQFILESEAGASRSKNLKQQIEIVANDPNTPEHVKSDSHDLREIGNFSAHANEDVTGQVLRAEPDEAEWSLQVLRTLFEHYYVGPARSKARKATLKAKLATKAKK